MARRSWALDLLERCRMIDRTVHEHNERTEVINRALGVAFENLKSHVGGLEHRFQDTQQWANEILQEQKVALDGWQHALKTLGTIPARNDFFFLARPSTPRNASGTLRDFVDADQIQKAGSEVSELYPRYVRQVGDLEKTVTGIALDTQSLLDENTLQNPDEVDGLLEEVETIANKISSDYEHVLGLPDNQKALPNISRLALNHTQHLLPSLLDISAELDGALQEAVKTRNAAARANIKHMRTVSSTEERLAVVRRQINDLELRDEAFDIIFSVFHMPMIYGSALIECVRRREWDSKMKSDSLTLAEDMAVFRDEEQRRRRKWVKSMGDRVTLSETTTPGIEVNLQDRGSEWPEVSRKEIEEYIEDLKTKPFLNSLVLDLSQLYKELDAPTRQQRRKQRAFKQGSIFDTGRSSLLLHGGDDMVKSLSNEKVKLEDRLKGSDSRVRKLEDLLHRQSQLSRPTSGQFEYRSSSASRDPDQLSRRSSASSRRMSLTDEKTLIQRIATLETELNTERETVQRMSKETHTERQSNSDKFQEAQSTKQDLVKNLEAQQREFQDELKLLRSEQKKSSLKSEELEEELDKLDKLVESRDKEKQESDERIQHLEAELNNARLDRKKADELHSQTQAQKEEEEQNLRSRIDELEDQYREVEMRDQENYNALHAVFMNLSPGSAVPVEVAGIIKAVEVLTEGLLIHANKAEDNAITAATENKGLGERLSRMESEADEVRGFLGERESELSRCTEDLSQERSKISSLTSELDETKSQLGALRSQLAVGEAGPEVPRERVGAEEQKVVDLTQELNDAKAQAQRSEEKVVELKRKGETASDSEKESVARIKVHGGQTSELSKQLFSQVQKLWRILEQLGFTCVKQDSEIVVRRASKVNASASHGDVSNQHDVMPVKLDAKLLDWMVADTEEEEMARFKTFMDTLSQFDADIFGDAVVKRVKDIELLARKWQKEAKGYRDKYHRVQSEAHEKIAYRSFKEGDLALFLPTRNQAIRSWAAFNVGAPHYFLREQDAHKLYARDWLLARITKIEERVVDLSRSMNGVHQDRRSIGEASDNASLDDENPFDLSDGLRWYLVDAVEEKPGAPATPGLGKSTVASAHVDAKGSIRLHRAPNGGNVARKLTRSLDSRRNSSASKKDTPTETTNTGPSQSTETDGGLQTGQATANEDNEVRRDPHQA